MIIGIAINICAYIAFINASNQWLLVWNDEFNGTQLDSNKWDVEDEKDSCHGSYNQQLQCHTSNPKNVRLTGDVLAITAIKENHLDKEYTSAQLTAKFGFTYGRIEIRAALPNGYMLRPAVYMIPQNGSDWPKNGQIDIMTNIQTPRIASGVHYYDNSNQYLGNNNNEYKTNVSLNDYHIYEIEWSRQYIKWFFDGYEYLSIDTNKKFGNFYAHNGQPFDHNFRLTFHLGIGGRFFSTFLTEQHVIDWKCSLFIFDYIRIYQLVDTDQIVNTKTYTQPLFGNTSSVNSICENIMSQIRPIKSEPINHVWTMIIILTVAVVVLILIVLALVLRSKMMTRRIGMNGRTKQQSVKSNKFDQYDDVEDDNYEQIPDVYYDNTKYVENDRESRYTTGLPVRQISKTGGYVKTDSLDNDYVAMGSKYAHNKN